ncbi:MAG: helix-turn-helix domain-containing protein [Clostridiales bacterium]|nr:helix-turn-helix domain-containing protein [Clostridiales bacterium]
MKKYVITKFFVPYLVILLVSCVIFTNIFINATKMVKKQIIDNNLRVLEQNASLIDQQFEYLSDICINLQKDVKIQNMQYVLQPFKGMSIYKVRDLCNTLFDFSLTNELIHSYAVLYEDSDLVVIPGSAWAIDDFFNSKYKVSSIMPDQWRQLIFGRINNGTVISERPIKYMNRQGFSQICNLLTYITTLDYNPVNNCAVIIFLDSINIKRVLKGINVDNGGCVYIVDDNNNILTGEGDFLTDIMQSDIHIDLNSGVSEITINDNKMLVTCVQSTVNGWRYVAVLPYQLVMSLTDELRDAILLSLGVYLSVGFVFSFLFTKNNVKPVSKLLDVFKKPSNEYISTINRVYDPFEYIYQNIIYLSNEKTKYQQKIKAHKLDLLDMSVFFERLLGGDYVTHEEVLRSAHNVGVDLEGANYVVILFEANVLREATEAEIDCKNRCVYTVLKDIIKNIEASDKIYLYRVDNGRFAIILISDLENRQEIKHKVERLCDEIHCALINEESSNIKMVSGGIFQSPLSISKSYKNARNVIENKCWNSSEINSTVIWYDEFLDQDIISIHTYDTENIIINAIKTANHKLLQEEYNKYLEQSRMFTPKMHKLYVYSLWNTAYKIFSNIVYISDEDIKYNEIRNLLMDLDFSIDINHLSNQIWCILNKLCEYYSYKNQYGGVIDSVIKFIEEKYDDQNLSLSYLANTFDISEAYLSRLFKEYTGESFSNYLESVRINQAKKLLIDSQMKIRIIAEKVGYTSANSFTRAFKKINGVTPSNYRQFI